MATLLLAMALCSASGHAPEGISFEVERPLDLSCEWKGTVADRGVACGCVLCPRRQALYTFPDRQGSVRLLWKMIDEGRGRLRVEEGGREISLGVYRWERDGLVICLGQPGKQRPASFRATDRQSLFTLRRAR
jgi:hypothetical protein